MLDNCNSSNHVNPNTFQTQNFLIAQQLLKKSFRAAQNMHMNNPLQNYNTEKRSY